MGRFLKKISLFAVFFLLINFALFYTLDNISSNERFHKMKFNQLMKFSDKDTRALLKKFYIPDPGDKNYYILKPQLKKEQWKKINNIINNSGLYNSVLDTLIPHNIYTGMAYEFNKFREINEFKNIDVLFLGSSHAFLGFDPRIFQEYNIKSFNLGVRGQGPLNSYYLLKRYHDVLRPKILIFECYFHSMVVDGYEAYMYTLINHPLDFSILEMGITTGGVRGIRSFFIQLVKRIRFPLHKYPTINSRWYIKGGYQTTNEKNDSKTEISKGYNREFKLSPLQLKYLGKILSFCKEKNIKVFMVTSPLPDVFLKQLLNYEEMNRQIRGIANKHNVQYIDFNSIMKLDFYEDFRDSHHLNQDGVNKFNNKLINILLKFDCFKKICQKGRKK